MSRVEWSRRTSDEVESLLGIALCLRYSNATRIRPSRGDKGVDVFVPTDEGWVVYQIKSFTGSLNASRKRQIKKSWDTFHEYVREDRVDVAEWHLLRPENPTLEDIRWLAELKGGGRLPLQLGGT